jgi:peptidoglycan/LPS O-acetylase OafA/YrhL
MGYWIFFLLAVAALVVSYLMRSSPDPHNREIARYIGYAAIAFVLVAMFFRRRTPPTPPMPRD